MQHGTGRGKDGSPARLDRRQRQSGCVSRASPSVEGTPLKRDEKPDPLVERMNAAKKNFADLKVCEDPQKIPDLVKSIFQQVYPKGKKLMDLADLKCIGCEDAKSAWTQGEMVDFYLAKNVPAERRETHVVPTLDAPAFDNEHVKIA